MNWFAIRALVVKDLQLFFRDRFFAFISVLGLAAYVAIYLAMPRAVDEAIGLGLYAPTIPDQFAQAIAEADEPLLLAESEAALRQAVLDGEISGGIAIPADLVEQHLGGKRPVVTIYLPSDAPQDLQEILTVFAEALVLSFSGMPFNIEVNEEVLGPDMLGQQIPLRDRMIPLFVMIMLMMEMLGLGALLADEIQTRTINALLVTPLGVRQVIIGKGITSVLITFTQAAALMLLIGGFQQRPLIVLVALLLGAFLVTAIGFLLGAAGKDMLSVMSLGIPVIILLSIPSIGIAFPGLLTGWARAVPSHYLADTLHQVRNMGAGWGEIWQNLLVLMLTSAVLLWASTLVLKRKFQ